jgi:hypothetical protein
MQSTDHSQHWSAAALRLTSVATGMAMIGGLVAVSFALALAMASSALAASSLPATASILVDTNQHPVEHVAPAQAFTRERVYRGDFMVTCRTDGACDAITFTDTPTATGGSFSSSLTFKRAAGPGTAWIMTFSGAFEGPVPGTPIEVKIGQQSWFLAYDRGYSDTIGNLKGHNYFLSPVNDQIVPAMVSGSAMDIVQTVRGGGQQTVRYSLRGLTAAMRWIDRKQNRIGEPILVGVPFTLEEAIPQ